MPASSVSLLAKASKLAATDLEPDPPASIRILYRVSFEDSLSIHPRISSVSAAVEN
jgi:hypothetical protein